jgi:hypothetical protein
VEPEHQPPQCGLFTVQELKLPKAILISHELFTVQDLELPKAILISPGLFTIQDLELLMQF